MGAADGALNTHTTMAKPTTTHRVDAIYMARVYLAQARTQRHRGAWHATLLRWAAGQRRGAMAGDTRQRHTANALDA